MGCEGGQGGSRQPALPATVASAPATTSTAGAANVALRIVIPTSPAQGAARSAKYISASTQSMSVSVNGGTATAFNLTPTSANCSGSGSSTTCNESFAATLGSDTFLVKLYDAAGASGNLLATNALTQTIYNAPNSLNLTLGGVVTSVAMSVSSFFPAGSAAFIPLTVNVKDADNNVIIAPGSFVDTNGNPVTINLSAAATTSGGSGNIGFSSPTTSSTSLTAPTSLNLTYDGGTSYGATISGTASNGATVTGTSVTVSPTVVEYGGLTAGALAGVGPTASKIVTGPDNNIWFTEASNNAIGKMSSSGTLLNEFSLGTLPGGLAKGPDGNIWFTEESANKIGVMSTSGTVQQLYPIGGTNPLGIVSGNDGALWFTEYNLGTPSNARIGRITTAGSLMEFPTPATTAAAPTTQVATTLTFSPYVATGSMAAAPSPTSTPAFGNNCGAAACEPKEIIVGPDNNIWFDESNGNACNWGAISKIVVSGTAGTITEYINTNAYNDLNGLASGPDGNIWVTEGCAHWFGILSPTTGVFSAYDASTSTGGSTGIISTPLWDIVGGPDGYMWFADLNNTIVRMTTSQPAATTPAVPTQYTGSPALGANLYSITVGPDKGIWFVDASNNQIGEVIW